MKTGIELVAQERKEQIEKHGRTVMQDVANNSQGQLIKAAVKMTGYVVGLPWPANWNETVCEKMDAKSELDKLVVAAAFLCAEIDRRLMLHNDKG